MITASISSVTSHNGLNTHQMKWFFRFPARGNQVLLLHCKYGPDWIQEQHSQPYRRNGIADYFQVTGSYNSACEVFAYGVKIGPDVIWSTRYGDNVTYSPREGLQLFERDIFLFEHGIGRKLREHPENYVRAMGILRKSHADWTFHVVDADHPQTKFPVWSKDHFIGGIESLSGDSDFLYKDFFAYIGERTAIRFFIEGNGPNGGHFVDDNDGTMFEFFLSSGT